MRGKVLWLLVGAASLAIPALAQDLIQPASQPAANPPSPAADPAPASDPQSTTGSDRPTVRRPEPDQPVDELSGLPLPPPPVEYPGHARRDPAIVGALSPDQVGLGEAPWGNASGAFLSTLMRRTDTPLASRWLHIALRDLLLVRASAPRNVNPVDWAAERAWLLLRMGEADAARLIVSAIDVDRFTPKMVQVAVQSALANADPAGLCPLQQGIARQEPQILQLVDAMCAAMSGEPEVASAQIDSARRRGKSVPIDLSLAQKVVGAGSNTTRAVTIEWEPVERINAWRFGLATATGMTLPGRLVAQAPVQLRAWQAQSSLLSPQDRLESAQIATGLGVFSSQALIDLHSLIYDRTGPDELPETDAWQLRQAFIGANQEVRLGAMHKLWSGDRSSLQRQAARAMLGRAATLIVPDSRLQDDAADLIASMLAAGFDKEAARWAAAVEDMKGKPADDAWALLALGSPDPGALDLGTGRIEDFIDGDESEGQKRSALLVAGLVALGRIDVETASRLNARHGLRLDRGTRWARMIDRAAAMGQAGTVLALTGTAFQTPSFSSLPPSFLLHSVAGLRKTGQDFLSRMIAAEALART